MSKRPWSVYKDSWIPALELFSTWLKERGGIVIYENHVMDSSHFGSTAYMPAQYIADEDGELHDAPDEYRPNGGLPSMRQQKVDTITLAEFDGDMNKALECFAKKESDGT